MFQSKTIVTAIEMGTSKFCVLIGESDDNGNISVIGHGESPSEQSVSKGEISDMTVAMSVLAKTIDEADKSWDGQIDEDNIYVAVTGSAISSFQGLGSVIVEDRRIDEDDIDQAARNAQIKPLMDNHITINTFDSYFMVDGARRVKNPMDQIASKLDAYIHVIHGDKNRINTFESAVKNVGFEKDVTPVFSAVASAYGVLTDDEKSSGVLLVEMGAGTTEFIVIKDYGILHSGVLQVGFDHVANDLSLGLDITISQAWKLLLDAKTFRHREANAYIELGGATRGFSRKFPLSSIEKIIDMRLRETFQIIQKLVNRENILPALSCGGVVSGGAALFPLTRDVMSDALKMPVRVGSPRDFSGAVTDLDSPRYSTVWGLLKYGDEMQRMLRESKNSSLWDRVLDGFDSMSAPFVRSISGLKNSIRF